MYDEEEIQHFKGKIVNLEVEKVKQVISEVIDGFHGGMYRGDDVVNRLGELCENDKNFKVEEDGWKCKIYFDNIWRNDPEVGFRWEQFFDNLQDCVSLSSQGMIDFHEYYNDIDENEIIFKSKTIFIHNGQIKIVEWKRPENPFINE